MSWLLFRMDLSKDPVGNLIMGTLFVMEDDKASTTVAPFAATSGVPGFQFATAQSIRGLGPVPANRKVGLDSYSVRTTPFDERISVTPPSDQHLVLGIDGNFYYIEPDPVIVNGTRRGEFGIHKDANRPTSPGSAGCIVIAPGAEWKRFEKFMQDYKAKGFPTIALIVEYNSPKPKPPLKQFLTVANPNPGEHFSTDRSIEFLGTAEPEVKTIIATVGPNGPFKIGQEKPQLGKWIFSQTLVTPGVRPISISALDEDGNLLGQPINFQIVLS